MTKSQIEPKITRNSSKLRNSFIVAMDCEFFSLKTISVCILQTPAVNLCLTILFVWNETSSIISYCFHFEWVCMSRFKITRQEWPKYFRPRVPGTLQQSESFLFTSKSIYYWSYQMKWWHLINEQWIDLLKGVRLNQRGYFW